MAELVPGSEVRLLAESDGIGVYSIDLVKSELCLEVPLHASRAPRLPQLGNVPKQLKFSLLDSVCRTARIALPWAL